MVDVGLFVIYVNRLGTYSIGSRPTIHERALARVIGVMSEMTVILGIDNFNLPHFRMRWRERVDELGGVWYFFASVGRTDYYWKTHVKCSALHIFRSTGSMLTTMPNLQLESLASVEGPSEAKNGKGAKFTVSMGSSPIEVRVIPVYLPRATLETDPAIVWSEILPTWSCDPTLIIKGISKYSEFSDEESLEDYFKRHPKVLDIITSKTALKVFAVVRLCI